MQSINALGKLSLNIFNIHPSQYFKPVEGYIYANPHQTSIAVLIRLLKSHGCPDAWIDQVVNGAIASLILRMIAPQVSTVQTFDAEGNIIPDNHINPTKEELIEYLIKERFTYLSRERAKKLLGFLIQKQALTKGKDGRLYLTMDMLPRQLIQL